MDRFLVQTKKEDPQDYKDLKLEKGNTRYYPHLMTSQESHKYYQILEKLPHWEKREIIVANRVCHQNRYSCYFATDLNLNYRYSGTNNAGHLFTPELLEIKKKVEDLLENKWKFNYCLLNFYPNGLSNIGMHSDDERDLEGPIASISLGALRNFDFHPVEWAFKVDNAKARLPPKERIRLGDGSMVLMGGDTQRYWKHGIPVESSVERGRINLTFRVVSNTPQLEL